MSDWKMEMITEESAARLPESRYHRMGGWLLVLTLTMALQGINGMITCVVLLKDVISRGVVLTGGIALFLAMYFVPLLLLAATLILLLNRKIAFRIPFSILSLLRIAGAVINIVENPGWSIAAYAMLAPTFAAWIVYVFASDRVRVYCNRLPKHPVPMPVPESEAAHWDASGMVYTDAAGNVTDFREPSKKKRYQFMNMPGSWRVVDGKARQKEE